MWVFSPSCRPPRFSFFHFLRTNYSLLWSKIIAGESPKTHRLQDVGSWMWLRWHLLTETTQKSIEIKHRKTNLANLWEMQQFCELETEMWMPWATKSSWGPQRWIGGSSESVTSPMPPCVLCRPSSWDILFILFALRCFYACNFGFQDFHKHLPMLCVAILPISPNTFFDYFSLPNWRHIHTFRHFWFEIWVSFVNCIGICLCFAGEIDSCIHVRTSPRLYVSTSVRLHVCTSPRLYVCTCARL